MTRLDAYHRANKPVPEIELGPGSYLLEALFEVGPASEAPMGGFMVIQWAEVLAYSQATGSITEPWEITAMIDMSKAYLRGYAEGQSVTSIPPNERD